MVGIFAFMLVFPLFMVGFLFLTNLFTKMSSQPEQSAPIAAIMSQSRPDADNLSTPEREISAAIAVASIKANDNMTRNAILEKAANLAIGSGYNEIALESINRIRNDNLLKNRLLDKLIDQASDNEDTVYKAIAAIANDNLLKVKEMRSFSDRLLKKAIDVKITK